MLFDLSNELQAENFKLKCNTFYQKKSVVELTERKPRRSLRQNAYLHAALGYFGLQKGYTLQEVKDWFFKETCNPELFIAEKYDSLTEQTRKVLRSSAELTTEEMTTAIERFRIWAAQTAETYIPSPEEHRLVIQMEIEVEKGKSYL